MPRRSRGAQGLHAEISPPAGTTAAEGWIHGELPNPHIQGPHGDEEDEPPPVSRKRGRPRKFPNPDPPEERSNPAGEPLVKRKRGRPPNPRNDDEQGLDAETSPPVSGEGGSQEEPAARRKRGRPRIYHQASLPPKAKRRRGRPRKINPDGSRIANRSRPRKNNPDPDEPPLSSTSTPTPEQQPSASIGQSSCLAAGTPHIVITRQPIRRVYIGCEQTVDEDVIYIEVGEEASEERTAARNEDGVDYYSEYQQEDSGV